MMKQFSGDEVTRFFLMLLMFALISAVACKKEEPASEKPAPQQALNPYTSDSVFNEVQKKLQENPNDVDALFHLADLYDRNNQYPEAIEAYKKVISVKPDMGYAYLKMGTAYSRLNMPAEAIDTLKIAARYMPKNPVVYNNLGVAYGKSGKLNEEIEALRKAIKLRPNYSSARYNLGVTYLKAGNKKAAMQEYESLMKFDEGGANDLMKEIKKAS